MKNKNIVGIAVSAVLVVAAGCVFAQQGQKAKTNPPQIIPSNGLRSSIDADPVAGEAFRAAMEPIAALEKAARQQMIKGNLKEAERLCSMALQKQGGINAPFAAYTRNQLAEIYVRSGQYQKGIDTYLPNYRYTEEPSMNLNVALAYARLGKYAEAKRYYSDKAILQYTNKSAEGLPGVGSPKSLEASILLARGMEFFFTGQEELALTDFEAVGKMLPQNPLAAHYTGMSLLHMNRRAEAEPYFRVAAKYGTGRIAESAKTFVAQYPKGLHTP